VGGEREGGKGVVPLPQEKVECLSEGDCDLDGFFFHEAEAWREGGREGGKERG